MSQEEAPKITVNRLIRSGEELVVSGAIMLREDPSTSPSLALKGFFVHVKEEEQPALILEDR